MRLHILHGLITAALLSALMIGGNASYAQDKLPAPTGSQILEVTGEIGATTDGTSALFDISQLQALGPKEITTSTPWTNGPIKFVGVPIKSILEAVKASGDTLSVTALNEYTASMPIDVLVDAGAILAYEMNGKRLLIRDKGPLWVIFPFDDDAKYRTDAYWAYAVWQVRLIKVQ
ncbi:MAG: molybdopterin-dependent oxidoreductase [Alphaproteobacteria bacterium]|nr:molybdopterin-dependent oxidoreductase [Alphaproteobacteria bacterium]